MNITPPTWTTNTPGVSAVSDGDHITWRYHVANADTARDPDRWNNPRPGGIHVISTTRMTIDAAGPRIVHDDPRIAMYGFDSGDELHPDHAEALARALLDAVRIAHTNDEDPAPQYPNAVEDCYHNDDTIAVPGEPIRCAGCGIHVNGRDQFGALLPIERDEPDRRQPGESLGAPPTTYVRAVELATELGIGPADVVRIALGAGCLVADAQFPIRATITNHTADLIREAHAAGRPLMATAPVGPPGAQPADDGDDEDDAAVRAGIAMAAADPMAPCGATSPSGRLCILNAGHGGSEPGDGEPHTSSYSTTWRGDHVPDMARDL